MIHGMIFGGMVLRNVQEVDYDRSGNLHILDEQDYSMINQIQTVSAMRASGGHKIASYLRRNGMDVEMIDYTYAWTFEELKDLWKSRYSSQSLFIAVSIVFGFRFRNFWLFIEWIRENYPHIAIIGGSQSLDKLLPFKLDWYVFGYGERAMLELITNLKEGTTSKIKYYMFPGNRKVINGQQDYKSYGPSMRDLSVSYEDRDFIAPQEILNLEFSRGCIFRCAFCTYPILGVRDDHSRDEKNLDTELRENYDRWGTTRYLVTDETSNDYSEKLERYAGVTKKLPFKVDMGGYVRGDLLVARKQDWPTMVDLGYMNMFYGIESMNHASAKAIHKGMDSGRLQEGLLEFKEYALKNHGFYTGFISLIAGLPHETFKTFDKTVEWLLKNWSDQTSHIYPLHMSRVSVPKKYEHLVKPFDSSSRFEKDPAAYGYEILSEKDMEERLQKEKLEKELEDIKKEMDKNPDGKTTGVSSKNLAEFKKGQIQHLLDKLKSRDIKSNLGDQGFLGYKDMSRKNKELKLHSAYHIPNLEEVDENNGREVLKTALETRFFKFNKDKFKANNLYDESSTSNNTKPAMQWHYNLEDFRMELSEMIWKSNTGLTMVDWLQYMNDLYKRYPIESMPNITSGAVPTWNFAEHLIDPSVPYKSMMESRSTQTDTVDGVTFASANNIFAKTGVYKHHFIQEYKRKKINA